MKLQAVPLASPISCPSASVRIIAKQFTSSPIKSCTSGFSAAIEHKKKNSNLKLSTFFFPAKAGQFNTAFQCEQICTDRAFAVYSELRAAVKTAVVVGATAECRRHGVRSEELVGDRASWSSSWSPDVSPWQWEGSPPSPSPAARSRRRAHRSAARGSETEETLKGIASMEWILEPIGDGDCSHLDRVVARPEKIELSKDVLTVGRVAGSVDVVIPVATVSSRHALLEKTNGVLNVTDLGSTNGTYINGMRISPNQMAQVSPGSTVIFGDEHLAMFRFEEQQVLPEGAAEEKLDSEESTSG